MKEAHSEADLISQFEEMNRPIRDLSFVSRNAQHSFVQGLKVGSLVISEAYMDPMVINTRSDPQISLNIPFSGEAALNESARATPFPASQHIVICPFKHETSFRTSGYHSLTYRSDHHAIRNAVSRCATGADKFLDDIVPDYASTYTGRFGNVSYHDQLISLLGVVNSCNGDADFLTRIGFDEIATRVLAEFLVAATGRPRNDGEGKSLRRSDRSVDIICDYIVNNLGTPLTIPQIEKLTEMSGRSINYAFHARFGKSPQQWQRDYLLDLARQELISSAAPRSVKSIAFDLGFSSSSSFSTHYKKKFGEHPTSTSRATTHPRPIKPARNDK